MIFVSNSDNAPPPIHLHQSYTYPAHYDVIFSETLHDGAPGDIVNFQIQTNQQLHGILTLDLDLDYNSDLLDFVSTAGPNRIVFSDRHLHISGNPYLVSDTGGVGSLAFRVYLTKDASTRLTLSNAHFNMFDPQFEECVATAAVIGNPPVFTSFYSCGDKTISDYLRNALPFQVSSAHPNPTVDMVAINLDSRVQQEILITVFDTFGRQQQQKHVSLASGNYTIPLDLSAAASGMYVVDISNESSHNRLHIVKEK